MNREPDAEILDKILGAMDGMSAGDFKRLFEAKFAEAGGRYKPGRKLGPRNFAWFMEVLNEKAGRARPAAPGAVDWRLPRDVFDRMSSAFDTTDTGPWPQGDEAAGSVGLVRQVLAGLDLPASPEEATALVGAAASLGAGPEVLAAYLAREAARKRRGENPIRSAGFFRKAISKDLPAWMRANVELVAQIKRGEIKYSEVT